MNRSLFFVSAGSFPPYVAWSAVVINFYLRIDESSIVIHFPVQGMFIILVFLKLKVSGVSLAAGPFS